MIRISLRCKNNFYRYVAFGIGIIYIFQIFLTVGGGIRLIPITGVTLPLVSYGVTSVLSTLMIFAVVQGVFVITNKEAIKNEKEKAKLGLQPAGSSK